MAASKRTSVLAKVGLNSGTSSNFIFGSDLKSQPVTLTNLEAPLPGAILEKVNIDDIEPAPKEWNFFEDQSEEKVINLAASLKSEGQMAPIIVRINPDKNSDKKYQNLVGHTRVRAAKMLVEAGESDFQELYAFSYPEGKCDDTQARRLVVYSNTTQRTNMTPQERQQCFYFEYIDEINTDRNKSVSALTSKLMDKYGIKRSHAFNLKKIGDNVIPKFQDMFQSGIISMRSAISLSRITPEVQEWLLENCDEQTIVNTNFKDLIGKHIDEVRDVFHAYNENRDLYPQPKIIRTENNYNEVQVLVPLEKMKVFRSMMDRFYKKYYTKIRS